MAEVLLHEGAAPGTPSAGVVSIYALSNGRVYSKDDAGAEVPLTASVVRVVTLADGLTITPDAATTDIAQQTNTQASGTVSFLAPTGAPTTRQKLMLILDCTNAQSASWHAIYRGAGALTLPATLHTGANYLGFLWHPGAAKWDLLAVL